MEYSNYAFILHDMAAAVYVGYTLTRWNLPMETVSAGRWCNPAAKRGREEGGK